ncbi:MAG: hypothetical protein KF878_07465 [Planctomycetes bacterium]|nr:hypothetical protein [Planctomycetota bacterium]
MSRWSFASVGGLAVVALCTAGCRTQRVAYEVQMQSEPVAGRRAAARQARPKPQAFPASAYAHGDARHRCDARCDTYWPDVYPHSHADHRCDASCNAYAGSRDYAYAAPAAPPPRRSLTVDEVHDVLSPRPPQPAYTPPPPPTYAAPTYAAPTYAASTAAPPTYVASTVYAPPPPPTQVIVYAHGHARHLCTSSCTLYAWPHGHMRHSCWSGCQGLYVRSPSGRFELRLGADPCATYPHGHMRHLCGRGCSWFAAPVVVTRPRVIVAPRPVVVCPPPHRISQRRGFAPHPHVVSPPPPPRHPRVVTPPPPPRVVAPSPRHASPTRGAWTSRGKV